MHPAEQRLAPPGLNIAIVSVAAAIPAKSSSGSGVAMVRVDFGEVWQAR